MTDKYPNIKRPIETAPKDGKILLWWDNGKAVEATIQKGPQEPENCCEDMGVHMRVGLIRKSVPGWFTRFPKEPSSVSIYFCPFCGEKMK